MNDLEKIESARDNLIEIYMPKLRHVENSGNGDTIHQVRSHILLIESSRHNSKYWKEINNIEKYSSEPILSWLEHLSQTKLFFAKSSP
jgi:hypothetical protein